MTNLKVQKRLAADVLKIPEKRVVLDPSRIHDIKEAITKTDIRGLVGDGAISGKPKKGSSKVRARKIQEQKKKGRRKGPGSRKGKAGARQPRKQTWMNKVRVQREFLKVLKEKGMIDTSTFKNLYRKSKGGFFRSKRHIKIYMEEHNMFPKK